MRDKSKRKWVFLWKRLRWYTDTLKPRTVTGPPKKLHSIKWTSAKQHYHRKEKDISLEMPFGSGKVTDFGNDRFRCLYTEIPAKCDFSVEVDITVASFLGKPGPNNREAFGFFVRDTMKPDPYTGEYYSNMAALGGYYGRLNFFGRTGISKDGIGSVKNFFLYPQVNRPGGFFEAEPLHYLIDENTARRFHLFLKKRGPYIFAKMTDLSGKDVLSPEGNGGDLEAAAGLNVARRGDTYVTSVFDSFRSRDRFWCYIGFFAANGSGLTVHTDTFRLILSDSEGKQAFFNNKEMPASEQREKINQIEQEDQDRRDGRADCEGRKYAEDREDKASDLRRFNDSANPGERNLIVSPEGSPYGNGTEAAPLDLYTAVQYSREGQDIILKAGRYCLDRDVVLPKRNDVAVAADATRLADVSEPSGENRRKRRRIAGEPGRVILDFMGIPHALIVAGDYWEVSKISVTRGCGIIVQGSRNIVDGCRAFENLETGIQIRHFDTDLSPDEWPSYNLIENCVSFKNRDPSECNADGFACKVAAGRGNRFRNCISWLNADDGFDLFTKNRQIGAVTIENCKSYFKGYKLDEEGRLVPAGGNGNGFKLGGSGVKVRHKVVSSEAAANKKDGFTSNSNPAADLDRCLSYNNGQLNFHYYYYQARHAAPEKNITGCVFEDDSMCSGDALLRNLSSTYEQ